MSNLDKIKEYLLEIKPKKLQELSKSGANANLYCREALEVAVRKSNFEIVKLITKNMQYTLPQDIEASKHLFMMSVKKSKNTNIVKLLLDAGADANWLDGQGCSALDQAIFYGCTSTAKLLIDRGANIHRKDPDGLSMLHLAVIYGKLDIVKELFCTDQSTIFIKDQEGLTPIDYSYNHHIKIRNFFLDVMPMPVAGHDQYLSPTLAGNDQSEFEHDL